MFRLGTLIQARWADAFRKPIIIVMEDEHPHNYVMVKELAGFFVDRGCTTALFSSPLFRATLISKMSWGVYARYFH